MEASSSVIETDALINSRKVGRPQIVVGVLGACALFVEGFDTSAIGYIAPQIALEWNVPASVLGTILTADMVGLLLGYLFVAPLSARFGHKRTVIACTTFFGLMTFLTITSSNVEMLLFFRFMTGVGVGGAMPSAVALTGEYIPENRRSTAITLIYIGFSIGQIGAGLASSLLIEAFTLARGARVRRRHHAVVRRAVRVRAAGVDRVSGQSRQRQAARASDACAG